MNLWKKTNNVSNNKDIVSILEIAENNGHLINIYLLTTKENDFLLVTKIFIKHMNVMFNGPFKYGHVQIRLTYIYIHIKRCLKKTAIKICIVDN